MTRFFQSWRDRVAARRWGATALTGLAAAAAAGPVPVDAPPEHYRDQMKSVDLRDVAKSQPQKSVAEALGKHRPAHVDYTQDGGATDYPYPQYDYNKDLHRVMGAFDDHRMTHKQRRNAMAQLSGEFFTAAPLARVRLQNQIFRGLATQLRPDGVFTGIGAAPVVAAGPPVCAPAIGGPVAAGGIVFDGTLGGPVIDTTYGPGFAPSAAAGGLNVVGPAGAPYGQPAFGQPGYGQFGPQGQFGGPGPVGPNGVPAGSYLGPDGTLYGANGLPLAAPGTPLAAQAAAGGPGFAGPNGVGPHGTGPDGVGPNGTGVNGGALGAGDVVYGPNGVPLGTAGELGLAGQPAGGPNGPGPNGQPGVSVGVGPGGAAVGPTGAPLGSGATLGPDIVTGTPYQSASPVGPDGVVGQPAVGQPVYGQPGLIGPGVGGYGDAFAGGYPVTATGAVCPAPAPIQPIVVGTTVRPALPRVGGLTGVWGNLFYVDGHVDGIDHRAGFDYDVSGVSFGITRLVSPTLLVGAFASYGNVDFESNGFDSSLGHGDIDAWQFGAYMRKLFGNAYWIGAFSGGFDDYHTTRNIAYGGNSRHAPEHQPGHPTFTNPYDHPFVNRRQTANFHGATLAVFGELGYTHALNCSNFIQPFVSLQYTRVFTGGFAETNTVPGTHKFYDTNLYVTESKNDFLLTRVGGRYFRRLRTCDCRYRFLPELRAYYAHQNYSLDGFGAGLFGAGDCPFYVAGLDDVTGAGVVGGGLTIASCSGWSVFGNYDAFFADRETAGAVYGGAQYIW